MALGYVCVNCVHVCTGCTRVWMPLMVFIWLWGKPCAHCSQNPIYGNVNTPLRNPSGACTQKWMNTGRPTLAGSGSCCHGNKLKPEAARERLAFLAVLTSFRVNAKAKRQQLQSTDRTNKDRELSNAYRKMTRGKTNILPAFQGGLLCSCDSMNNNRHIIKTVNSFFCVMLYVTNAFFTFTKSLLR